MKPTTVLTALLPALAALAACSTPPVPGGGTPPAAECAASARCYHVSPDGDDAAPGTAARPVRSIQKAVDLARPGDTVILAPGEYLQDFTTSRDGKPDAPITVRGPDTAIVRGQGTTNRQTGEPSRIVQVRHDHWHLEGFTVDGLYGDPDRQESYRDKLIYVMGTKARDGVTGLKIDGLHLRNAGGECLRLRYFAVANEIANSSFRNCGRIDFHFDTGHKNGEGIYLGTAPEQRGKNGAPTSDPDVSRDNWIHDNDFDTQGNECVDIKEDSTANVVERNTCTGQKDPESAGFDARGSGNVFRDNKSYGNAGAGVRLGGDTASDGTGNDVYGNVIRDNAGGGIKFMRAPQGRVCGNTMSGNAGGNAVGSASSGFAPAAACP